MRWIQVACLGALLIAVDAQQPAHDEITVPRATDAPDTDHNSTAPQPAPMDNDSIANDDQINSENTSADDNNEDNGEVAFVTNDSGNKSEGNGTPNPEAAPSGERVQDESEQEESGDTSATVQTNSDENNSESPKNSGGETAAPNPYTNILQSSDAVKAEIAGDEVETEGGLVQGYYLNGNADLGIRSYYDIPYGTFSDFKPPEKHPGWEEVREITHHQTRCPQPNEDEDGKMEGDLDCLTLSVFAPNNVENAGVLFHIHDGNFQSGSADPTIYGPQHLVSKGVILVLPNYRLNALGFLCERDSVAPGNAGLKDLTLALEWTNNNIDLFGGDPSKIVVSGDGTAGALAGYLAISPMSRNYISSVIAESGSVLAHWAIDRNPGEAAATLLRNLNRDLIDTPIDAIVTSAKDIKFKPCIEEGPNAFLNKAPWTLLHEDNINTTFMLGAANHAGLHEAMQHSNKSLSELSDDFSKFLPNDLEFKNDEEKAEIGEAVKKQYFGDDSVENIEKISLCYTDAYYLGPTIRAARPLVAAGSKVYFYEFSFVGYLNRMHDSLLATVQGAARGDIIGYVFVQDDDVPLEDSEEAKMVDLMTDLWVTFIETGTPMANNVEWAELENVEESEEAYLLLDSQPQPRKGLREELALWTKIYNEHFVDRNAAIHVTFRLYFLPLTVFLLFYFG